MKGIKFVAKQKYRLDLGIGLLSVFNFILLLSLKYGNSTFFGLPNWAVMVGLFIVCIIGIWLLGYIQDKIKFKHAILSADNERNPEFNEIKEKVNTLYMKLVKNEDT